MVLKLSFGGDTVNITGGNLNMGGNKITNVQKALMILMQ